MFIDIKTIGTEWKGRLQLAISMTENEKACLTTGSIRDGNIVRVADAGKKEALQIFVEVHYALNLPKNEKDYCIRVRWGPEEVKTKKREVLFHL